MKEQPKKVTGGCVCIFRCGSHFPWLTDVEPVGWSGTAHNPLITAGWRWGCRRTVER
jgi:hypothetical protein